MDYGLLFYGLWFMVYGVWSRIWGLGFGFQGLGFGVWGLGFGVPHVVRAVVVGAFELGHRHKHPGGQQGEGHERVEEALREALLPVLARHQPLHVQVVDDSVPRGRHRVVQHLQSDSTYSITMSPIKLLSQIK